MTRSIKPAITAAFRQLRKEGLLARQSFTCCQSCAWSEIEYKPFQHGAVFYTQQDAADLEESNRIFLAFGSASLNLPRADEAVGRQVARALRDAGLAVEWDGTAASRIMVSGGAQ